MNKVFIRQVLPVLLAVGLLWYVLKDVPVMELVGQFYRADYRWLLVVGSIIAMYFFVRAARWQLTLQALGYQPSLFRAAIAILAGTMASMIIPGAGELTRCGTLQRTDDVPLAQGFGSVVAERVIDVVVLGGLIALTFLLEIKRVGQYITDLLAPTLHLILPDGRPGSVLYISLLIGLVLVSTLYWMITNKAFRRRPLTKRLVAIGHDVKTGFLGIRQLRQPVLFVGLTTFSYILSYLVTYVLFLASPQTVLLPPTAALTVLTVSSLGGLAVPTQGGLGTYHFLVSRVLMLYGLTETESVITATFMHAVQTGFTLLFSSLSFLILPTLIQRRQTATARRVVNNSAVD